MSIHNSLNDDFRRGDRDLSWFAGLQLAWCSLRLGMNQYKFYRSTARLCLLIVGLITLPNLAQAAEPIYSKTNKFKIPFQYDQFELKKLGATEIQLYVSDNQGASWKLHETVKPDGGKFSYQSPQDGEFWFSVRTLAAGGLTYPAGPHDPGLKVVVDTMPPELSLDLTEIRPGEVELEWISADSHLNLDSFKLEFLESQKSEWEAVNVRPAMRGKTSWSVAEAGLVEVRGTILDTAGNSVQAATQTIVAGKSTPPSQRGESARPIASESSSKSQMLANQPINVEVNIQPNSFNSLLTSTPTEELVLPKLSDLVQKNPESSAGFTTNSTGIPGVANPTNKALIVEFPPSKSTTTEASAEVVLSTKPLTEIPKEILPEKVPADSVPVQKPALERIAPSVSKRVGHLVNSRTFRIAYQLEDVGPSGISRIELYITENGGEAWFHYGSDNDHISPMIVTVPKDGEYGFSFRIRNGAGFVATPPQPGDKPEIQVTVDETAPEVTLAPGKPRVDLKPNQVLIEWTAQDRELDLNPIAIYYATNSTGPWELIEGWRPNSSQLVWTIPTNVVGNFYTRLDVRDAAGNVTRTHQENEFTLDDSRPKARITEVESLNVEPVRN